MIHRKYTNMHANKGRVGGFFAVLFVFMCIYNWIYNYASTDKEKSIKEKNK